MNIPDNVIEHVKNTMLSMKEKLAKARFEGYPGAPDIILTSAEATIAYRLLFEKNN